MKERCTDFLNDAFCLTRVGLIIAIPMSIFLFHVYTQYRISDMGYQIAEVTQEHRELLEEYKKLSIEAAIQGRSDRVEALARERFGLQYLRADQVISVRLGESGPVEHALLDR
ncbi:MAG: cell division protein FtsL [Bradymonadaceae bacterium]